LPQSSQINALSRKEKKTKEGESYSFSLFPTDFAEKSEWFDKSLLSKKKVGCKNDPIIFLHLLFMLHQHITLE
jgi:hypothetical protein